MKMGWEVMIDNFDWWVEHSYWWDLDTTAPFHRLWLWMLSSAQDGGNCNWDILASSFVHWEKVETRCPSYSLCSEVALPSSFPLSSTLLFCKTNDNSLTVLREQKCLGHVQLHVPLTLSLNLIVTRNKPQRYWDAAKASTLDILNPETKTIRIPP